MSFSKQPNLWIGHGEFLVTKWKRTCGLGVVNTSRHTSHPWSAMFPYGLCPSGIAGVLIIKHSKNGSCEAVDRERSILDTGLLIIASKENNWRWFQDSKHIWGIRKMQCFPISYFEYILVIHFICSILNLYRVYVCK